MRSATLSLFEASLAKPEKSEEMWGEPTGNNLVENNVFVATGDDSIGIFNNDRTTVIRNNRIYDSFARGIFLYQSPQVQLGGNMLVRSPLLYR
jgi:hypothetical protein